MRKFLLVCFAIVAVSVSAAFAQKPARPLGATTIQLPQPNKSGGMTLTEALTHRRSTRTFTAKQMSQAEISQLLWAAQGITDDKGHRTAPSASAQYYLHIYLATADGFFEYIPGGHQLKKLQAQDLRAKLSVQPSVKSAPFVLLIAGEYERAAGKIWGRQGSARDQSGSRARGGERAAASYRAWTRRSSSGWIRTERCPEGSFAARAADAYLPYSRRAYRLSEGSNAVRRLSRAVGKRHVSRGFLQRYPELSTEGRHGEQLPALRAGIAVTI